MSPLDFEPPMRFSCFEEDDNSSMGSNDDGFFPECSKGHVGGKKWPVTTSHVQAYIAMRGGHAVDTDDALFDWIHPQDQADREKGKPSLLRDIGHSHKEKGDWPPSGPATFEEDKRQSVFKYDRPKVNHLDMSGAYTVEDMEEVFQNHEFQDDGWLEASSDVSDDEGDPANGRISPCTFAAWATGCMRWDAKGDNYQSTWEARETYDIPAERTRPPSPNRQEPRERKDRTKERQFCHDNGKELTPICSSYADTVPSVLWSPPPMEPNLPADFYTYQIDRMDPELARTLRKNFMSSDGFTDVESAETTESYTKSEVDAAVEKHWGVEYTDGVISRHLRDKAFMENNEEQCNRHNERYRHEITTMRHENRKLKDCLEAYKEQRARRIMKNVARYVSDLSFDCKAKLAEVKARWREQDHLKLEWDAEKETQIKILQEFGKRSPEEVFAMFPEVWDPLEVRKNRRNYS